MSLHFTRMLYAAVFTFSFLHIASALTLTLSVPPHIPALPSTSTAYLESYNRTLTTLITRANTFKFIDIDAAAKLDGKEQSTIQYLLDVACRDYDFASYGVDVKFDGKAGPSAEVYRMSRGGSESNADRAVVTDENPAVVELKVLKAKEHYETRVGFNPAGLLKNPMILIGVVGLAFVVGIPYLLENMDPETRKEFEETQKQGVFGTGASTSGAANPLQNFDMAAWMAGRQQQSGSPAPATGQDAAGSSRARRRG